tara:strand:+ start:471 stop:1247 length:777 start_codon:yes stop_codon:yes gene_type:complete
MKKILLFLFKKESIIIKYLSFSKNAYENIKVILPFVKSNKLIFILNIIKSAHFVKFQTDIKNEQEYFKKKYLFNHNDWFSSNFNIWKKFLKHLEKIKYLEIGTFEGRSAVFVGELKNTKEITCVDNFKGNDEPGFKSDHINFNFDQVYENCLKNLKKTNVFFNLIKDKSDNFFLDNNEKFNVIYIDGSHYYEDLKNDFINSKNCLEKKGILICDDFLSFAYKKKEDNPIVAILECYNKYKNNLEVLFIHRQIIFKNVN